MAFIDNQDENLDPNQNGQGPGQSPLVGQGSSVVSGGGGTPSSSAAGVGPGGTGGWTNIQAYLNANQGDTGSAQALNNTIGGQFGQERKTFQDDSAKIINDAQSQASKDKVSTDEAGNLINSAAYEFNYGSQPNDAYFNTVKKMQNALTGEYSGPKDYNYGFSDKTQQYGNDLGDNASFDSLMKNVYAGAAKSPLSSGQYQLQKQFDVNNSALGDTRKSLEDQYTQLGTDRDNTVKNTTNQLGGIEQGYRQSQNALNDYLNGQSNSYDTKEKQAEADARAGYQNSYANDKTGRATAVARTAGDPGWYAARGVWGSDLTPQQLQNEQNMKNNPSPDQRGDYYYFSPGVGDPNGNQVWKDNRNDFATNTNTLNNFYSAQDTKYANTGDAQKRAYNAIQDFLQSNAARKQQGFKVRG